MRSTGNGCWVIFDGKKVMLPAGVVRDIDLDAQTASESFTKRIFRARLLPFVVVLRKGSPC
jgi:hypothetical protein